MDIKQVLNLVVDQNIEILLQKQLSSFQISQVKINQYCHSYVCHIDKHCNQGNFFSQVDNLLHLIHQLQKLMSQPR